MLRKENVLDRLNDCMPIINMIRGSEEKQKIFELEMKLSGWHHHYNLYKIGEEVKKMEELLGNPTFKGKNLLDYDIEFFMKENIWTFVLEENKNAIVVLYLNKEGLSVEVSYECKNYPIQILEELIKRIII